MNAVRVAPFFRRLLRHRLLHFAAIAACLFALAPREHGRADIDVGRDQLVMLFEKEARLGSVPLSREDKQRALDTYVEEEILYREGLRIGLDRDDSIVRARIVHKMASYAENASETSAPPNDAAVRAHYDVHANEGKWRDPARARFEAVFVAKSDHADARVAEIEKVLAREPDTKTDTLGDGATLPPAEQWVSEPDLVRIAGAKMGDAVFRGPVGKWSAKVVSTYGFYLVRDRARDEVRDADFESARPRVVADLGRALTSRGTEAYFARVARSYRVHVDAPPGDELTPSLRFTPPALRTTGAMGSR